MGRVVVTGMAGVTSLGCDWATIEAAFRAGRSGIRRMHEWDIYRDLLTRLGGPVDDFRVPVHWTRKQLRSMGRASQFIVRAAEIAVADAGLTDDETLRDGSMGVSCGSSMGATDDIRSFGKMLIEQDGAEVNGSTYVRVMPHTTAANIGIFFGLKGRIIPTSSACTSGSQGIGYAYEAIRFGRIPMMLAGGSDALCASEAKVFDALYATSQMNDTPERTPRPFDMARDGLVIGEGGGMLVLEDLEHALARGAHIHAEIVGYGCSSDGSHVTRPEPLTMRSAMQLALDDAGLSPSHIGYLNAHGTATEQGDVAEADASAGLFPHGVPTSSQKSYLGHTLGACGALEAWFSIEMMNRGWFAPTAHLDDIDPRCAALDHIVGGGREIDCEFVMSNNFAFGGVNTSLIFKRYRGR